MEAAATGGSEAARALIGDESWDQEPGGEGSSEEETDEEEADAAGASSEGGADSASGEDEDAAGEASEGGADSASGEEADAAGEASEEDESAAGEVEAGEEGSESGSDGLGDFVVYSSEESGASPPRVFTPLHASLFPVRETCGAVAAMLLAEHPAAYSPELLNAAGMDDELPTALHQVLASAHTDSALAVALLDAGADPLAQRYTLTDLSQLHVLCDRMAGVLRERAAVFAAIDLDTLAPVSWARRYASTPLTCALENGQAAAVEALLASGAQWDASDPFGYAYAPDIGFLSAPCAAQLAISCSVPAEGAGAAILRAMEAQGRLAWADHDGNTLLHHAARDAAWVLGEGSEPAPGPTAWLQALLGRGYARLLEAQNLAGMTPLGVACAFGFLEAAKLLLAAGANPRGGSVQPLELAERALALHGRNQVMNTGGVVTGEIAEYPDARTELLAWLQGVLRKREATGLASDGGVGGGGGGGGCASSCVPAL